MAVMLPNATLTVKVRARPRARDARGVVVSPAAEQLEVRGTTEGGVIDPDGSDGPDGGGWRLRIDTSMWPIARGDVVVNEDTGDVFIIRDAHKVSIPGVDDVDYIRVTADLDPPVVH